MKTEERKGVKYTCAEAEQLYGIGYHKVYEDCKGQNTTIDGQQELNTGLTTMIVPSSNSRPSVLKLAT